MLDGEGWGLPLLFAQFWGDTGLLTISSTNPVANTRAASASGPVLVPFSEAVTAGSTAALKVFSAQRGGLRTTGSGLSSGSTTVSGSTVRFAPTDAFRPGETVQTTVTTAATATAGIRLATARVLQFTVAAGSGPGKFSGGANAAVGSRPASVVVADVDGDGDLDMLVANSGAATVSVRLNNGSGVFSGGTDVAVGARPSSVVVGDVDGDGDLDLLTANSNAATVSVRFNQPPVPVPVLTSLSPTSGPVGTSVTITGTNFTGGGTVSFNGTAATSVTFTSATSLTAVVPTGASSGNVTVTTSGGTSNGVVFTVTIAPAVTTAAPATITSATLGGNVTADGGTAVTERGVVYSTSNTTPTTADTKAANGSGTGTFSATTDGLTPGTTYYVRAYAINSAGMSYGSVVSFTTLAATVASVTRLTTSPTATAQVRYQAVFSRSVSGVTVSNFNVTNTGSVSGTNVSSVVGAGTTYTVTVNLSTTPVYLRDKQTGAVVDLARQPSYNFVVSNATALIAGRFELVFSPQAVLATAPAALAAQVGVYPNPASTTAFVELPAALGRVAVAAELVDTLGRTVRAQALPAQGAAAHRLELDNLATGVYTLHLSTSAGVVVKKLVVE